MGWGGRGTYFLIIFYDNKTQNLCQRFCQKDPILPSGSQRGGLDLRGWPGWAGQFWGKCVWMWWTTVLSFCTCRKPIGKRGFGARMCNLHTPGVQLLPLVLLYPQLPRGASWSDQTLTFQDVAHEGHWPTDRNSDRCLNKQDSKLFKHFRSKIFKLFCVKYVVSQDWEFIFSFVYYILQKLWYSP